VRTLTPESERGNAVLGGALRRHREEAEGRRGDPGAAGRRGGFWRKSMASRSNGATSLTTPRAQCSSPAGERIRISNGPPTTRSTLASGMVKPAGANQRLTASALLHAA